MSENEKSELPKPHRRLNHERFGKDEGELAIACWRVETNQCIAFELWLYSCYEPTEEEHTASCFVPDYNVDLKDRKAFY